MQKMQQSPFENIFNIIGGITEGNEKPMKHGFYNAFALVVLALCCAAVYVLFLILEPFFKPLFWALLVGSILHPFKYRLSKRLKSWFEDLEKNDTSVVFGLVVIPVNALNNAADTVGEHFLDHYKGILSLLSVIFVLPWLYNAVPRSFSCLFWQFISFIGFSTQFLINFSSSYITLTIVMGYFISVYVLWTPERSHIFRRLSIFVWLVVTGFLASLTGSFQVYMFVILQILGVSGFVVEVMDVHKSMLVKDPEASLFTAINHALLNIEREKNEPEPTSGSEDASEKTDRTDSTDRPDSIAQATPTTPDQKHSWEHSPRHARMLFKTRTLSALPLGNAPPRSPLENRLWAFKKRSIDDDYMKTDYSNDDETALYFKLLFFSCSCMLVWNHMWLLPLTLFFLVVHVVRRSLDYFGVRTFFENRYNGAMARVGSWWKDRQSALVPVHCRGALRVLRAGEARCARAAYDCVDDVSAAIVIVALVLFAAFALVFIIIQIYSEALVVVQMTGAALNGSLSAGSPLRGLLPAGFEDRLDGLIDDAYEYGRRGLSSGVKNLLKEGDPEKVSRVEQQILELWDRVYQSWVSMALDDGNGPQVDSSAVRDSWTSFYDDVTSMPGILDYAGLVSWLQANVGTLQALAAGVWAPLASNAALLAGSAGAVGSLLLCGGSAIISFLISLVVFATTLFYLLASSGALYKPVEAITRLQPGFGPRLGIALSVAINQVFRASFKMALFYGLWTWLIHNIFGAKVVYLPSVLAAVLGAAPFLGPYLAALPAALELWLAGRAAAALALLLAQAAPVAFLDAAVYKEIKDGGHPYVTGLSIVGGIYYLGPEGAILGPLLLCCLVVALHLSSACLRDTPAEERAAAALHSRVRLGAYL